MGDWPRAPGRGLCGAGQDVTEYEPLKSFEWDVEADVVVVGFGAAGMAASVTAHELGCQVVILEKAPEGQEGGNTRVAGQGYLNTSSAKAPRRT